MTIHEIYNGLRTIGLTDSQYHFSREWLGRCNSYMSSTVARQREVCPEALLTLSANIAKAAAKTRQTYQHIQANVLDELSKKVWMELLTRYGSSTIIQCH